MALAPLKLKRFGIQTRTLLRSQDTTVVVGAGFGGVPQDLRYGKVAKTSALFTISIYVYRQRTVQGHEDHHVATFQLQTLHISGLISSPDNTSYTQRAKSTVSNVGLREPCG